MEIRATGLKRIERCQDPVDPSLGKLRLIATGLAYPIAPICGVVDSITSIAPDEPIVRHGEQARLTALAESNVMRAHAIGQVSVGNIPRC